MKSALQAAVALAAAAVCSAVPAAATPACTDGGVISYPPPPATDGPFGITAGPGGTWYAEGDPSSGSGPTARSISSPFRTPPRTRAG
jgi:hypothetical protein